MKALSIKNPWGYLIATGLKNVENRSWRTNFRWLCKGCHNDKTNKDFNRKAYKVKTQAELF